MKKIEKKKDVLTKKEKKEKLSRFCV